LGPRAARLVVRCGNRGFGGADIIEAEGEDLDFLRTTSFGLLQVR
jgi:hypothetical protein